MYKCASIMLLKKKKEMHEVDDALDFMKEEFRNRMEACEERQREFERRQEDMKAEVTRFEKFIHENDSKRARAEQRTKAERQERTQKERRIGELERELAEVKAANDALVGDSEKLRTYQHFLEQVVEMSPGEFDERDDVMNRHKTLSDAHDQLKASVDFNDAEMDKERNEMAQMRRDMQNEVLVQNSEVHAAQKQLETLRSEAIKADIDRGKSERALKARSSESGQVTMSIKNLSVTLLLEVSHAPGVPSLTPPSPSRAPTATCVASPPCTARSSPCRRRAWRRRTTCATH